MKTLNLQKYITKTKKNTTVSTFSSIIASIFSVIFSLSILKELHRNVHETYLLIILGIFVILFLIYNEHHKVQELRKRFDNKSGSILIIIFTFIISLSLSSIGIYIWTDRSFDIRVENSLKTSSDKLDIDKQYAFIIDSIENTSFDTLTAYINLSENLSYWKGRSAASLDERVYLRSQVEKSQQELNNFIDNFNQDKKDKIKRYAELKINTIQNVSVKDRVNILASKRSFKITLIFIIMIILTEIMIISLAKEWVDIRKYNDSLLNQDILNQYITNHKIITEILSRKDFINVNDIKFSPFSPYDGNKQWEAVKNIFGFLKQIGIADIEISKEDAQQKLKDYYENILKF